MKRSNTSSTPCASMACSGTALLFTDSNYIKFVGYNLKVMCPGHVSNSKRIKEFYAEYVGMFLISLHAKFHLRYYN
jgi:hypothetical protein